MQPNPAEARASWKPQPTTVVLMLYIVFGQITELVYAVNEIAPPAAFTFLQPFVFLGLICWWLQKDSARTGVSWPMDAGMFLYVAWFLVLPYHLVKTRGLGGLLDILLFIGIVVATWVLASVSFLSLIDTVYH
jgi:hypothetical protein